MEEIKKGDKVKMSEELKKGMIANGSGDHVKEFGDCEGYVEEGGEICDFEVRWEPSRLIYGYDEKDLVKVVDMNKPKEEILNKHTVKGNERYMDFDLCLGAMDEYGEQEAARRERIAYRKGLNEAFEIKDAEIKELDAIIKNFEDTINQRIAHLNSVDADFCKDRWDMTKPENERNIYREMSNQVTATRQELEMIKRTLSLPESDVKADQDVRAIAHKTYLTDMAAFAEGCGKPFTALAWHIYKRAFDIASYSLRIKPEPLTNGVISVIKEALDQCEGILLNIEKTPEMWQPEAKEFWRGRKLQVEEILAKIKLNKQGEFIICSAVRWQKTIICGRKHKDCYDAADALLTNGGFLERERKHQGFMTSTGRYVDRAEAFKIAKANYQIVHKLFDGVYEGSLNSEDLFGEK